ncbi:MAG: hypothetical protein QF615_10605, partial [Planctomycetota bacterium]|nr:hypothetical protein [Planctomycetota bacterium]
MELRRTLPAVLLIPLSILLLALALASGGDTLTGLDPDPAILRGQSRLTLWTAALVLIVPAAIAGAARAGAGTHRAAG